MGTFPVQKGAPVWRRPPHGDGRGEGFWSLLPVCYMTKDPLSPGFFPHRPGGYLKVPSQPFKGAQIPSSVRATTCLVLSPRNAALPTQIPTTPRPDTLKVPSQPHNLPRSPAASGRRQAPGMLPLQAQIPTAPKPDTRKVPRSLYKPTQIPNNVLACPRMSAHVRSCPLMSWATWASLSDQEPQIGPKRH